MAANDFLDLTPQRRIALLTDPDPDAAVIPLAGHVTCPCDHGAYAEVRSPLPPKELEPIVATQRCPIGHPMIFTRDFLR